ncbi:MAG: hypothetical protein P8Y63_11210 [Deltaproteobacteria bacterium]
MSPGEDTKDPLLSWIEGDKGFVYQREGRSDPFVPFIPEKLIEAPVDEKELTGMRRFEPGQLTLVSIVFTESKPLAMVQDSTGKGYIITKGSKIGRSGVVSEIIPNEVVIEQKMLTTTGEKRTRTVEMVLRKEGEK